MDRDKLFETWERVFNKWTIELRAVKDDAVRLTGKDDPRKSDVRFVCLADIGGGQSWLKFPKTFDMEDENAFLGSIVTAGNVLDFSDLMILGMAFPNILGVLMLSGKVRGMLNDYQSKLASGEIKKNA